MAYYFNRYNQFTVNGDSKTLPYVKLPTKDTDKFIEFKVGINRLDKFSDEYYSSPYFSFLILLANPEFGGLETLIPDGSLLRIPYPLKESLEDYKRVITETLKYYGE